MVVDLDHFFIARAKTGNWAAVRYCFANPVAAILDQRRIFDRGDVGVLSRLLSHLVIAGVLVPLFALESVAVAILTGVVLYVHVVCDIAWDLRRLRQETDPIAESERGSAGNGL
ncbi:hypothetical protein [Natrialba sp. INN-245]|uniref:hypothetical protein n=1 Tax=Natrialba sp. INN-245 TaxID=2690967 RepID=UPI001310987B|nr:hypothetical protein [Natrialba sp. INN-245]MWV39344.1 hypothetical protein [Natrialba sp. INN-245]